jgi:quercetin dioxygenase-like cupin family protein
MSSTYDCSQVVDIADEPHHHLVIANEYVRAFAVEIPPRTRTLCHHHPHDYLLYIANGAEIVSAARDEEPKRLSYVDGECELSKAGLVHVVDNLGDAAFRNVVVEPLPAAARLKRGAKPTITDGNAQIEEILGEGPGAVFVVVMEPGAEAEIAGPAVIAAPYGPVMVKELEEFDVALDDFRKLMWVCAPRKVGIRNPTTRARAIVFQLGRL